MWFKILIYFSKGGNETFTLSITLFGAEVRTENKKYYESTLNYCKLQVIFKSEKKFSIEVSTLTFKKTKPSRESSIRDEILQCDNNPSFVEFTILTHGNKKYILEIKKSLLIKRSTSPKQKH